MNLMKKVFQEKINVGKQMYYSSPILKTLIEINLVSMFNLSRKNTVVRLFIDCEYIPYTPLSSNFVKWRKEIIFLTAVEKMVLFP